MLWGGGLLFAAGMALMPVSSTPLLIVLTSGVMVGFGMGAASVVTILSVLGRLVSREKRSWALGIATAAASMGQFVLAPTGSFLIEEYGWRTASWLLAGLMLLVPVYALAFARVRLGKPAAAEAGDVAEELGLGDTLAAAFRHPSYVLLLTGFFVCGFQLSFITLHLPPYLEDVGIGEIAGWTVAAIGLFNVFGAYAAGVLGGRHSNKLLLSGIYLGRAVAIALFILLPPSPAVALAFGVVAGILWLSTVPLTSGLVALMFGTRHLVTLFGLVFFGHQVGSFVGAWIGGTLHAMTGSYDAVWWASVALSLLAAVMHYVIVERPAPRFEGAT